MAGWLVRAGVGRGGRGLEGEDMPSRVAGVRSPYPTVEKVTSMNQAHLGMLSKSSSTGPPFSAWYNTPANSTTETHLVRVRVRVRVGVRVRVRVRLRVRLWVGVRVGVRVGVAVRVGGWG